MQTVALIALLSSFFTPALSAPAPAPQFVEDPAASCDLAGYTKTTAAYYFDSSGTRNNYAACSALCKADSKCKSFGFGEANCLLFDVAAGDNTNLNPMSPYTFYDVGCVGGGTPSSTAKPPASTAKPPSSTPKPPSSTPKPPATSTKKTTTTTKKTTSSSSKYTPPPPPKTTSTKKPTSTKVAPPTKTREEETGPSSTRCPVPLYYKCGGWDIDKPWEGCTVCEKGAKCIWQNDWYYQCVADDDKLF